MKYRNFRADNW